MDWCLWGDGGGFSSEKRISNNASRYAGDKGKKFIDAFFFTKKSFGVICEARKVFLTKKTRCRPRYGGLC